LCVSLKHSCRFASFVLIAKGHYPAELDILLPFSLVNNNVSKDCLEITPAFWWLYNMYALARNSWKFRTRDKRKVKVQNIELSSLAPDTIEEIIAARRMLAIWTAKADLKKKGKISEKKNTDELAKTGRHLLEGTEESLHESEILGENIEKSARDVVILKPALGYQAYGQMLLYYAIQNLMDYMESHPKADFAAMSSELSGKRVSEWVNLGGQLMPASDADKIRADIGSGKLNSWDQIHQRYNALWQQYPLSKQKHAFAVLCEICDEDKLDKDRWFEMLDKAVEIQEYIRDQVYITRKKDFENPFRQATYRNMAEMTAAIGTIEDNSFVKQVRAETEAFIKKIDQIKKRG
jgi:hypothetical protein